MFLYGSLLIQQLADKNNEDDEKSIRKKLKSLPHTLTDAFEGIISEVNDDDKNSEESCRIAQDTFKWLLHAQRTLKLEEFLEAVSAVHVQINTRRRHRLELLMPCISLGFLSWEEANVHRSTACLSDSGSSRKGVF